MSIYDELNKRDNVVNPTPVVQDEPGFFMSGLRWADRLGQVVRNTITGNPEGALRQLADFVLEPVDALIPFDVIPTISRPQDYVEGSDILNMDEDTHWAAKLAADIGIGIVTDPLTYLTLGTAAGAKAVAKGVSGGRKALSSFKKASRSAKSLFESASKLDDPIREAMMAVKSAKDTLALANTGARTAVEVTDAATALSKAGKVKAALSAQKAAIIENALKIRPDRDMITAARAALENPIGKYGIPFTDMGWNLPINYGQMDEVLKKVGTVTKRIAPTKLREGMAAFANKFGQSVKGGLGWLEPAEQILGKATRATADGNAAVETGLKWIDDTLKNIKPGSNMDKALVSAMHNIDITNQVTKLSEVDDLAEAVTAAAAKFGVDRDELWKYADETSKFMERQGKDLIDLGVVSEEKLLKNYFPREWEGDIVDSAGKYVSDTATKMSSSQPLQHRVLETTEDVINYITEKNGAARLNDSTFSTLQRRIMKQGSIVTKAKIAQEILGPGAKITDDFTRDSMKMVIDTMLNADPDSGKMLKALMGGNPPSGWFADVLAVNNKIFKPAATFGLILPRFSFHVRNKLSSIWQHASVGDWKGATRAGKTVVSDLTGAASDTHTYQAIESGLRSIGIGLPQSKLTKRLRIIDEAMGAAKGSVVDFKKILAAKDKELLNALEAGVLDGFVSTEGLLNSWAKGGKGLKSKIANYIQDNAIATQGLENRMRLGSYLDLRSRGKSVAEAAKTTNDALLNYSLLKGTGAYANMRNFVPFLAFTAQSIPQQLKFLYRQPGFAVGLAQIFGQHSNEPVLPWISGQTNLRVGNDNDGNPLYMTSFGLPVEVLQDIPDMSGDPRQLGKTFREGVVGAAHPLLKAAYGYITGQDPFFQSTYGAYDKTPAVLTSFGAPERSEASRIYREIASSGILQPVLSAEQQISRLFDQRFSPAERALMTTTGMRFASSDPDKAMLQILQEKLRSDPNAVVYESYRGGSDDADELIKALREARKRLKEKRKKKEAATMVQ